MDARGRYVCSPFSFSSNAGALTVSRRPRTLRVVLWLTLAGTLSVSSCPKDETSIDPRVVERMTEEAILLVSEALGQVWPSRCAYELARWNTLKGYIAVADVMAATEAAGLSGRSD